jgi:hypothetical protein
MVQNAYEMMRQGRPLPAKKFIDDARRLHQGILQTKEMKSCAHPPIEMAQATKD